jgi:hypothetical protein
VLTVPVKAEGKYHQTIRETEMVDVDWARTRWESLWQNYRRAKHFEAIAQELERFFILGEDRTLKSESPRCLIIGATRFYQLCHFDF